MHKTVVAVFFFLVESTIFPSSPHIMPSPSNNSAEIVFICHVYYFFADDILQ